MKAASQTRNAKGEWLPDSLPYPSPLFYGPWKPMGLLKHLWAVIWPYNLFYAALAFVCWLYLTPSLETTAHFRFDWIALLYLRNAVLLTIIAGGLHLRLYLQRAQGLRLLPLSASPPIHRQFRCPGIPAGLDVQDAA